MEFGGKVICRPIYPDKIFTIAGGSADHRGKIHLFPSLALNARVVDIVKTKVRSYEFPIVFSKIDFSDVVARWMASDWDESLVIDDIQTSDGYDYLHRVRGDLVVYCTIIEEIAHSQGVKEKKYEIVKKYSSSLMAKQLAEILAVSGYTDVGLFVGDLRGEIAHTGKPRKILAKLEFGHLCAVAMFLRLVVLGYILNNLNIPGDLISLYQSNSMISHEER